MRGGQKNSTFSAMGDFSEFWTFWHNKTLISPICEFKQILNLQKWITFRKDLQNFLFIFFSHFLNSTFTWKFDHSYTWKKWKWFLRMFFRFVKFPSYLIPKSTSKFKNIHILEICTKKDTFLFLDFIDLTNRTDSEVRVRIRCGAGCGVRVRCGYTCG